MGCRGTACLTVVFIMKAVRAAPSSLTLMSEVFFISQHLVPLSSDFHFTAVFFLRLLKHVGTEVLSLLLIVLALARGGSVLELPGTGFIRCEGSF